MKLSNGLEMNVELHEGLVPVDTLFIHVHLASNTWWEPSLNIWKDHAKAFGSHAPKGKLIFAEWRGCGKTAAPSNPSELHPAVLAGDYILALRQLGVRKVSLVGHSTGGLIALFALLQAPELFDRAILLDPVSATGIHYDASAVAIFTKMSQDRSFCAAVLNFAIYGNDASRPLFQKVVDDAFGVASEVWTGIPAALGNINILPDLARIMQPVLVLHGEQDKVLPIEDSKAMAAKLPRGHFEELKGQGHSTNLENPELFVTLVDACLYEQPEQNTPHQDLQN